MPGEVKRGSAAARSVSATRDLSSTSGTNNTSYSTRAASSAPIRPRPLPTRPTTTSSSNDRANATPGSVFSALRPKPGTSSPRANGGGGGGSSSFYGSRRSPAKTSATGKSSPAPQRSDPAQSRGNNSRSRLTNASKSSSAAYATGARKGSPAKSGSGVSSELGTPLDSASALAALADRYQHDGDSSQEASSTLPLPPPKRSPPVLPPDDQLTAVDAAPVTHMDGAAAAVDAPSPDVTAMVESSPQANNEDRDIHGDSSETIDGGKFAGRRTSLRGDATAMDVKELALEVSSSFSSSLSMTDTAVLEGDVAVKPPVGTFSASKGDEEQAADASVRVEESSEQSMTSAGESEVHPEQFAASATGAPNELPDAIPSTDTATGAGADLPPTPNIDAAEHAPSDDAAAANTAAEATFNSRAVDANTPPSSTTVEGAAAAANTAAEATDTSRAVDANSPPSSTTVEGTAAAAAANFASASSPVRPNVDPSTVPPLSLASVPPAPPLASSAEAAQHAVPEKWMLAEKGNRNRALQRFHFFIHYPSSHLQYVSRLILSLLVSFLFKYPFLSFYKAASLYITSLCIPVHLLVIATHLSSTTRYRDTLAWREANDVQNALEVRFGGGGECLPLIILRECSNEVRGESRGEMGKPVLNI